MPAQGMRLGMASVGVAACGKGEVDKQISTLPLLQRAHRYRKLRRSVPQVPSDTVGTASVAP